MKVLVSGANGFVGRALCSHLSSNGNTVAPLVRRPCGIEGEHIVSEEFSWTQALKSCYSVVHLAGRVHVLQDRERDSLRAFRAANVDTTLELANRAFDAGVRRFVFVSTAKVNGEETILEGSFRPDDVPALKDPYAISKWEAEQALRKIASETGMEVVIIRPPLVYGPGVKANFQLMMRWLARGVPLPLAAAIENRRSLVALDNLVDLIVTCLNHPAAANQTFMVSDGEDLSTADLLRRMGEAQGTPARLFYMPLTALKLGATLIGKKIIYQRLCGSLQVDIDKTRRLLNWTPPVSVDEGLRRAAMPAKG
jgi:nucleoside-diphosphate-sugar epimerase